MSKFEPGDVVNILTLALPGDDSVVVKQEGVLVYDPDRGKHPFHCFDCEDEECFMWSNILLIGGGWRYHIQECSMELSKFGQRLRAEGPSK